MCNPLIVKCHILAWRENYEDAWVDEYVDIPFVMLPKVGDIIWAGDTRVLVKEINLDIDDTGDYKPYYCIECDCSQNY